MWFWLQCYTKCSFDIYIYALLNVLLLFSLCFTKINVGLNNIAWLIVPVTEREVRRGIINARDPDKHCLAYIRQLENMDMTSVRVVRNFVDMVDRSVDTEAEYLLTILRDDLLPTRLPPENVVRFTVDWTGDQGLGVDTHADYLQQFCEIFYRLVVIENASIEGGRSSTLVFAF